MDLTINDQEFLNLLIPEETNFNQSDIIDELNLYIYKIMNLSVENLIQEQVNRQVLPLLE